MNESTEPLLNKEFLHNIGIDLDEVSYQALSGHYEETLFHRVTQEIVEELSEEQLTQLHTLAGKDTELGAWLKLNVPQLREIVEDEIAILLGEIAEHGDRF